MARIKCQVILSGEPDKYISAIKAIYMNTKLGLHKSRDIILSLSNSPDVTVETDTKKSAVALVKEISLTGVEASWKKR